MSFAFVPVCFLSVANRREEVIKIKQKPVNPIRPKSPVPGSPALLVLVAALIAAQLCEDTTGDTPRGYDIISLDVEKSDPNVVFTIMVDGISSNNIPFTQYFRVDLDGGGTVWYYVTVNVNEASSTASIEDTNMTCGKISASYTQLFGQITINVPLSCFPNGDLTRIYAENPEDVAPDRASIDPDGSSCEVTPPIPVPEPFYAALAALAVVAAIVLYARRGPA